jgi:hypothetical protein
MNKALYGIIVLITACCTGNGFADSLKSEEVIPRFYLLLTQHADPSVEDEEAFFGGSECENVRSLLLSGSRAPGPQTPIWEYLRRHREMFVPQNSDLENLMVAASNPFTAEWLLKKGTCRPLTGGGANVLVVFPARKMTKSGYNGVSAVEFALGQKCYLVIGGTLIFRDGKSVLEIVYDSTRESEHTR